MAGAEESSGAAAGRVNSSQASRVQCVGLVHNFPDDDDDAESTVRSLFEPDLVVQDCQLSTTGWSQYRPIANKYRN